MRVGLLGTGFIGKLHADILCRLEGVELAAVLVRDRAKAADIASRTGCQVFDDPDRFFMEGQFEAADICLPTYRHEEMILKALRAGKDVLCEKPLTLSVKSACRIQKEIKRTNRIFMIAQVIRFWPQYRKIRELVRSGAIGDIESVHAYRLGEAPPWATWFRRPEQGGGALFDLHIHDVDFVYSLCGKPKSLFACGKRGEFGAWDAVTALWDWRDRHAVIRAEWTNPPGYPFRFGIRAKGVKGALEYRFQVAGNVESLSSALEELTLSAQGREERLQCPEYRAGYEEEIRYFLECAQQRRPVEQATIGEAVEVLRLVEEEKASLETGERRRIM